MISRFWLFAKILGNILLEGIDPITYEQENIYSRRLPAYEISTKRVVRKFYFLT